ncbi:MAG: hypothetical protein AB1555_11725 [Nitrospirota bacterium]
MRWVAPLLFLGLVISISALAQPAQLGPAGDFRVDDRPGTAPMVGPPGGPSPPPGPTLFRDFIGAKRPDEILKSLDRDLGRGAPEGLGAPSGGRSLDLEKDLRPSADKFFK